MKISGSPLLLALVTGLAPAAAGPGTISGEVEQTAFEIAGGGVRYREMKVRLDRSLYVFSGRIGLDGALDMTVAAPIPAWIKEGRKELAPFLGDPVRIPLKGTMEHPSLDVQGIVERLLLDAARKALLDRLGR